MQQGPTLRKKRKKRRKKRGRRNGVRDRFWQKQFEITVSDPVFGLETTHLPAPRGTLNDVGPIPTTDGTNMVKSFTVASPDPAKYTDIMVNYTVAGEHALAEGFVVRYGEIGANGTTLRSYGEGTNWRQSPNYQNLPLIGWGSKVDAVWQQNHQEIINGAR